jgi:hypothetical protein
VFSSLLCPLPYRRGRRRHCRRSRPHPGERSVGVRHTTSVIEKKLGPVLNAENIKANRPKILRPTHFSCMKDIKADSFSALTNINADMFKSGE